MSKGAERIRFKQSRKVRFWVCALSLVLSSLVFAVLPVFGAGEHGAAEHAAPGLDTLFYPAINFVIYLVILVLVYRKLGAPALVKRHQLVKSELERAAIDLNQAEREREGLSKRLGRIEDERVDLLNRYESEGKQMSETIIRNGKAAAERAALDGKRQIENEISQARKLLQRESVFLATKLARKKLESEFLAEEDKRLRKMVLQEISN